MTTRRRFIQTLAAIPPALYYRPLWAAPDPSRLALVIGNSSYHDAPLVNPANDAKAMSGLFTQAGFTVDSHLNARRADMMAAIERFGIAVKKPETKLVVFYYAGHGAQLDWRNYLLPVDAVVQRQEDMKERCVDLNLLLGQLSAAKDKTFVIILDACRNNPFGTSYRPEQKGLSQFDAPVGSLLAYATSPGNVASDGSGENGLYTENLIRELSQRNTRIEDALKRVRLNVRLASKGEQIPWETTSLEGDVFIFNEGQKKLTEAEAEKLLETEIAEWSRIKNSKKIDDWVAYLRTFPNGRFAEIAQMRMARMMAETASPMPATVASQPAPPSEQQRLERERQEAAKAEKLAAEKRQQEELKRQEEQKRLEQERAERERIRLAEAQRLAVERKQLEEQQAAEARRREEEQKAIEAKRRQEQERLEQERQRIAEAERQAEERRKQEEQRLLAEQKRLALEAEARQKTEQRQQEEQQRLAEQKRLEQERAELERQRLAEAQRLAAERKRLEEQQAIEARRREEEQKAIEAKHRQEQERMDKERQRIAEAERQAEERRKQEEQRLLVERKRLAQEKLEREERERLDTERKAAETRRQEQEKAAAAPKPAPSPAAAAAAAGSFMINIGAGLPVPQLMAPSDNPFSAGRYPLARLYSVGDEASFRQMDMVSGGGERNFALRVTKVDPAVDRIELNNGESVWDLMGNAIKQGSAERDRPVEFAAPLQFSPAEFQVGKKWAAAFTADRPGRPRFTGLYDMRVATRESVVVPAGRFDTFRIEGEGWGGQAYVSIKLWLVPGLNFYVKLERIAKWQGRFLDADRQELVALRQQFVDTKCRPATGSLHRTLAIKSNCA